MPRSADQSFKLLPNSSTKLEKDVARCLPFDGVLQPMPGTIRGAKLSNIPESFLPWLIIEYGLGELAEFITDKRELIEQGLLLSQLRGTPAAVKLAFGWLGYDDVTVWEHTIPGIHFAEWQADLGRVPRDMHDLCRLAKLAKIVQPVRARFRRVYHGYDKRKFRLDSSKWGQILSGFSGVRFDEQGYCSHTGLIASFSGNYGLGTTAPETTVGILYERVNIFGLWVHPKPFPRLDVDYPDSFYPRTGAAGLGMLRNSDISAQARARWQSQRRTSRSVQQLASVGLSHTTEFVPPTFLLNDGTSISTNTNGVLILNDS